MIRKVSSSYPSCHQMKLLEPEFHTHFHFNTSQCSYEILQNNMEMSPVTFLKFSLLVMSYESIILYQTEMHKKSKNIKQFNYHKICFHHLLILCVSGWVCVFHMLNKHCAVQLPPQPLASYRVSLCIQDRPLTN